MSHSERRGQVSMEFMAYFGTLLMIFVLFGPVLFNRSVAIKRRTVSLEASRVATSLEKEINNAVRFGDGYRRTFTVPESLSGHEYNITLHGAEYGSILRVEWSNGVENRRLITSDTSGDIVSGENTVENSDGTIKFNDIK